jgi:hypothetical protein
MLADPRLTTLQEHPEFTRLKGILVHMEEDATGNAGSAGL